MNFKVRCTHTTDGRFKAGKVYLVNDDGTIPDEFGDGGFAGPTDTFEHWYKDAHWSDYDFELVKEIKMFTKNDLKVGYVLEFNDDPNRLAMVLPTESGKLCISGPYDWFSLEPVSDDLNYMDATVTKVFGRSDFNGDAYKLSTWNRELIWQRNAVKEISVDEATKLLTEKFGQNVRIRVGE